MESNKLNKIFKWGMVALIVISVVLLVWGFLVGFETNEGVPVDVLLRYAYVMVALALVSVVVVGLITGIKNNPKGLVKLGIGIGALAVLCAVALIVSKGEPALGIQTQPDHFTLKLTDTLLNLTYICGAAAFISIIAGEVRMAVSNKKK